MIKKAVFKCSSEKISQVPKDALRDIAFIGRSNVGKSSLINMLTGHKGLAKVSGTPGKTKLINHFLIDNSWYLVDLPGYGYARTSKSQKEQFSQLIVDYVKGCEKMHFESPHGCHHDHSNTIVLYDTTKEDSNNIEPKVINITAQIEDNIAIEDVVLKRTSRHYERKVPIAESPTLLGCVLRAPPVIA